MNTLFWSKIQRGDEGAFRQLYEQYADLLYGYGMKIAGDDTLVTEAIQSLFVYIFEKRETCAAPQSIPAYLCVSLRHMIVNELKKENSGSFKSLDEVGTNISLIWRSILKLLLSIQSWKKNSWKFCRKS